MKLSSKEKSWILKNASKRELESVHSFLKKPKKQKSKNKKEVEVKSFYPETKKRTDINFASKDDMISYFRQGLLTRLTESEKEAYELLDILGIEYIKQYPMVCGDKFYFADLFIPSKNLIVEIDGMYHKDKSVANRDRERSERIRSLGYKVIRYDNENIFNRVRFLSDLSKRGNLNIPSYMYL